MNPDSKPPVHGNGASHERQMEYWTQQLKRSNPAEFLLDKPRPGVLSTSNISKQEFNITSSLYDHIQRFSKDHQVPPLSILLAAFRVTHFRLSGTEDATIGTNKSGASLGPEDVGTEQSPNWRDLQCIRIKVQDEFTFEQVVRLVDGTLKNANLNQEISFGDLISQISPQGSDLSRHLLIQMVFSLNFTSLIEVFVTTNGGMAENCSSNFPVLDLEFRLSQTSGGLYEHAFFCQDLFHEETIRAIIEVFYEVLNRGMGEPKSPIASLRISGKGNPEKKAISSDSQ
ncbi:hypothetical protein NW752_009629 [Fusarium irregulare]|uniref:Condensation domain-containing protein n=1 Tax=Fusarium irregulare TaxID=2494466 RepID=A0A9W8PG22_9HYPO|nr:hypothetical protein NW766_011438 [Fusarium irregulare]KAJ4009328.1 hypothetical protein NW752_009629 [Fusarium irregulare]